jgi:hypothetical protein
LIEDDKTKKETRDEVVALVLPVALGGGDGVLVGDGLRLRKE